MFVKLKICIYIYIGIYLELSYRRVIFVRLFTWVIGYVGFRVVFERPVTGFWGN